MKALIIEDESVAARRLARLLIEINEGIEILGFCESIKEAKNFLEIHQPDIIFSDIQLQDGKIFRMSSFEDNRAIWIFTTAFDQYAEKAFKKKAFDYILKPVRINELKESVRMAKSKLMLPPVEQKQSETFTFRILVKIGFKYTMIEAKRVMYIYHKDGLTIVVNRNRNVVPLNMTFKSFLEHIEDRTIILLKSDLLQQLDAIRSQLKLDYTDVRLVIYPSDNSDLVNKRFEIKSFNKQLRYEDHQKQAG